MPVNVSYIVETLHIILIILNSTFTVGRFFTLRVYFWSHACRASSHMLSNGLVTQKSSVHRRGGSSFLFFHFLLSHRRVDRLTVNCGGGRGRQFSHISLLPVLVHWSLMLCEDADFTTGVLWQGTISQGPSISEESQPVTTRCLVTGELCLSKNPQLKKYWMFTLWGGDKTCLTPWDLTVRLRKSSDYLHSEEER